MDLRARPSSSIRYAERLLRFRLPLFLLIFFLFGLLWRDLFWSANEWGGVVPLELQWGWLAWSAGAVDLSHLWEQLLLPTLAWVGWLMGRGLMRRSAFLLLPLSLVGWIPAWWGWPLDLILPMSLVVALVGAVALVRAPGSALGLLFPAALLLLLLPLIGGFATLTVGMGGYRDLSLVALFALSTLTGELLLALLQTRPLLSSKRSGKAVAAGWLESERNGVTVGWFCALLSVVVAGYFASQWSHPAFLLTLLTYALIWVVMTIGWPLLLSLLSTSAEKKKTASGSRGSI